MFYAKKIFDYIDCYSHIVPSAVLNTITNRYNVLASRHPFINIYKQQLTCLLLGFVKIRGCYYFILYFCF